jgi:GDP-L-fucose synthase
MIDWSRKNVLVSGGSGFLGSFLIDLLRQKKAKRIISPSSKEYDLRDISNCKRVVRNVDVIFHLAAKVGGIGLNLEKPAELFYDNLMMGVQLINEAQQAGVEKFLALGTICSYPKFATIPFTEDSIWDGYPEETNAPYGLAKKMLLVQSQAYRRQYGFNSIVVFPTNLYGPRDNFDPSVSHVIPALILKVHQAKVSNSSSVTVWGDGSPTRDFLYVEDAAAGLLRAAEIYEGEEPINLGSEQEISIKDLVYKIVDLMDYSGEIIWDTSKPNGQPRRCVSSQRARELIGFRPAVNINEGLKRTISWFENEIGRSMILES